MSMSGQDAEEHLRLKIRAMRDLGASQAEIDAATAQSVLHEDLGYFRSKSQAYDLDQPTRDKLLSHARQDAAHAVCAVVNVAKEVRRLRSVVLLLAVLVVVLAALIIVALLR